MIEGCGAEPLAPLLSRYARLLAARPDAGPALASKIVQQVTAGAEDYLSTFASRLERLSSLKRSTRIETLQRIERARAFIHDHQDRAAHPRRDRRPGRRCRASTSAEASPRCTACRRSLIIAGFGWKARPGCSGTGAASPTELAERLGYASLSAFTRAFRQAYGVPPSRAQ